MSTTVQSKPYPASLRPKHCVWELTLACNLRCKHCGSRAGKQRENEMSIQECLRVVEQLAGLGTEIVTLSGGEPTLHKDWYQIACAIRDKGMIANMVTNGYELDNALANQMKKAGLVNVGISVDGTEQSHDRVRRKGSYKRSLNSLGILKKTGVKTAVLTTVNRYNIDELDDIHRVLIDHGVNKWRVHLGKPMGNMKTNKELVVKPDVLLSLLPALLRIKENSPLEVGIGDTIGYHSIYDAKLRAMSWDGRVQCWGGCQAGLQVLGIESDGTVKGCLSIQPDADKAEQFSEGNIRNRSLESIWSDRDCFAYNRRFSCNQLKGFCRKCEYRFSCRGGAKCMAIAATGTTRENPYCHYRVSKLAAKQPALTPRRCAAATAAAGVLILGGYPEKVAAQEEITFVQSEQITESSWNSRAISWLDQQAVIAASLPPDDCISVVYGIDPPPQIGTVSGTVFATVGGESVTIGGAKITLSNEYGEHIGFSDSDGQFLIPAIGVGEYNVTVEKDTFKTVELKEVWICTDKTTILADIFLLKNSNGQCFSPP